MHTFSNKHMISEMESYREGKKQAQIQEWGRDQSLGGSWTGWIFFMDVENQKTKTKGENEKLNNSMLKIFLVQYHVYRRHSLNGEWMNEALPLQVPLNLEITRLKIPAFCGNPLGPFHSLPPVCWRLCPHPWSTRFVSWLARLEPGNQRATVPWVSPHRPLWPLW